MLPQLPAEALNAAMQNSAGIRGLESIIAAPSKLQSVLQILFQVALRRGLQSCNGAPDDIAVNKRRGPRFPLKAASACSAQKPFRKASLPQPPAAFPRRSKGRKR